MDILEPAPISGRRRVRELLRSAIRERTERGESVRIIYHRKARLYTSPDREFDNQELGTLKGPDCPSGRMICDEFKKIPGRYPEPYNGSRCPFNIGVLIEEQGGHKRLMVMCSSPDKENFSRTESKKYLNEWIGL